MGVEVKESSEPSVRSVREYIDVVFAQGDKWNISNFRPGGRIGSLWFRGEPVVDRPLLPRLYRSGPPYRENVLLQRFRQMAALPEFALGIDRNEKDQWLYIARHMGLPTRLLDWSEGALTSLYFAVMQNQPSVVWMLAPLELNRASGVTIFELPFNPDTKTAAAIRAAWGLDNDENQPELPLAFYPTHVHARLRVQQSCFTVHGKKKENVKELMDGAGLQEFLRPIPIDFSCHQRISLELRTLGVTYGSLFPDGEGLARDLTNYWVDQR